MRNTENLKEELKREDMQDKKDQRNIVKEQKLYGNVVILWAEDFYEMYLLGEYLQRGEGNIYCLLRDRAEINNFIKKVEDFFDECYKKEMGRRIFFVYGDVADEDLAEKLKEQIHQNISTVIYITEKDTGGEESGVRREKIERYSKECRAKLEIIYIDKNL